MRGKGQVQTPHNPVNPWMITFGGYGVHQTCYFMNSPVILWVWEDEIGQGRSCFSFAAFPSYIDDVSVVVECVLSLLQRNCGGSRQGVNEGRPFSGRG